MFNSPSNFKESQNKYTQDLQAKIDETYWLSSDTFEIGEELERGTLKFSPMQCRIVHAINPTTGLNLGDDWKELIFFDLSRDVMMGTRFFFDNSVWMIVNTDQYKHISKSAIVRRCNNVLKFKHNGYIVEEPCIIEYALKYANVYYNNLVDLASGSTEVICQNNEYSRLVDYNNRYIFGSQVYKVKTIKDYLRQNTFDKTSNPLIVISVYTDSKAHGDNFVDGIAWQDQYNENESKNPPINNGYEVVVNPIDENILMGEEIVYECYLYENGIKTSEVFSFVPSGVPLDNFEFEVLNGNSFKILNKAPYFKTPLLISCQNQKASKDISINLRGYY